MKLRGYFWYGGLALMMFVAGGDIFFEIPNLSYGYLVSAIAILISLILRAKEEKEIKE